jgi:uncharacterized protein (TIGR00661 family)
MRLLYGVQATGNGHTTRARIMAQELEKSNIQVDYLFSGRRQQDMFNMEIFGQFTCLRGMTLFHKNGKLLYGSTILKNNALKLISDIANLDLKQYDLVLTDFEPITAWAAKIKNIPCLGMAHQYAFRYKLPKENGNFASSLLMNSFAPANTYLGLHWHHWDNPILPPLIEADRMPRISNDGKVLVYLPFENPAQVLSWLKKAPKHQYYFYTAVSRASDQENIHLRPFSRNDFLCDFASCTGVISSAGFGLLSEAIHYGKKLLVKPLMGQVEQLSNTRALVDLGFGMIMDHLDSKKLATWLASPEVLPHPFPNTARAIASWIALGMEESLPRMTKRIWDEMEP